jgi:hypothetical protein
MECCNNQYSCNVESFGAACTRCVSLGWQISLIMK